MTSKCIAKALRVPCLTEAMSDSAMIYMMALGLYVIIEKTARSETNLRPRLWTVFNTPNYITVDQYYPGLEGSIIWMLTVSHELEKYV